jgi:Family of unknown function (DUF6516)
MALDAIYHAMALYAIMKAALAYHDKQVLPDGIIVEMKIWEVPKPVAGSGHTLEYSLFYGRQGERLVCYDNERGKEESYAFTSVEMLIEDFKAAVRRVRGES